MPGTMIPPPMGVDTGTADQRNLPTAQESGAFLANSKQLIIQNSLILTLFNICSVSVSNSWLVALSPSCDPYLHAAI